MIYGIMGLEHFAHEILLFEKHTPKTQMMTVPYMKGLNMSTLLE